MTDSSVLPRSDAGISGFASGRSGRFAAAVVATMTALSVVRAFGPLTYPGDIWRQADTAAIARHFARNGMDLFFPQIDWGGAGAGFVETELPLMPWLTAVAYLVFGEHEFLGRLVSSAFMLVASVAFWGLARRTLPPAAARWAVIAFAVSPAFLRWGSAFMPDAAALAFTVVALLSFCRWIEKDHPADLVGAGVAASMAGLIKPTALQVGLVMAVWLALAAPARLRRPSLYLVGVAALVAPALWLRHASSLYTDHGNTFGVISGGDSKFGSMALWLSPEFFLGLARAEVLFVFGVIGVPFAVVGARRLWRDRRAAPAFAVVVGGGVGVTALFFLAGRYTSSDLGLHYHLFALPYAALATGAGLAAAAGRITGRTPVAWLAASTVVALLAAQSIFIFARSFEDRSGVLGVCAQRLTAVSTADDLVVVGTSSPTVQDGVANNFQEPVVLYRADRRGWVLASDQYPDTALLARYQEQGARFFVDPAPRQRAAAPALDAWLGVNARPVATTAADGCDIWTLRRGPAVNPGAAPR